MSVPQTRGAIYDLLDAIDPELLLAALKMHPVGAQLLSEARPSSCEIERNSAGYKLVVKEYAIDAKTAAKQAAAVMAVQSEMYPIKHPKE